FHPPEGLATHIRSGVVEPDGAILVGGDFSEVEGQARSGLARLQKDGRLDPVFAPVVLGGVPVAKLLYPDGWLLVGGEFTSINGQAVTNVARVFNRAPVPVPPSVRPAFSKVTVVPGETARLETTVTGWPPPSLQWRRGEVSLVGQTNRTLTLPAVNADRAGTYTLVASNAEGTAQASVELVVALRSPAPGQVDSAASVTLNPLAWVMALVPLADGRFLLGGRGFQDPGDTTGLLGRVLTRVLPDGSPDPTFAKLDPVDFPDPQVVRVILPTEGGSYYVGGNLRSYQGRSVSNLIRIGHDGQLDMGFAPTLSFASGSEAGVLVTTVQHLGDGRIAVGGQFDTVNGKPRKGVAILRNDGSLDEGFDARLASAAEVRSLRVLPGGRILVGGGNLLDGSSGVPEGSRNLVRLAPDGRRDPEFISDVMVVDALVDTEAGGHVAANGVIPRLNWILPGGGRDPGYQSLNRLNPDPIVGPLPLLRGDYGDVYVGIGPRASLDSVGQVGLAVAARLPASGIVDVTFAPTGVPACYTTALAWNAEGRLVAASVAEGQALSRLYVFRPDPDQVLAEPRVVEGQLQATLATLSGRRYALETRSPGLSGPWQRVEEFDGDGFLRSVSVALDGTAPRYVRVQRIR
ncbi:MAG: immunoglobulin domain-containing protein, partial [Verrucomicrobiales bacterium]|nr:immunoglobulin domain-containing protein [Verrucomicrobiales bacterium]